MTGCYLRSEVEPLLAEFAERLEPEARCRLAAHVPELLAILRRDGYDAFDARWRELVDRTLAELVVEFRERLAALEVAGFA